MKPQQTPVTCNTFFRVYHICHLRTDSTAPSYLLLLLNYVQNLQPHFFAKVFLDTINVETLLLLMESGILFRLLRSSVHRIVFPTEASEATKSLVRDFKRVVSFSTGVNLQKGLIWSFFSFFFFAFGRPITVISMPLG